MKEMTEKEIEPHLDALGLSLYMIVNGNYCIHSSKVAGRVTGVSLEELGIKIVEEKPDITIRNLGLFMAKFDKYPEADFKDSEHKNSERDLLTGISVGAAKYQSFDVRFRLCKITDPRWTSENLSMDN